MHESGTFCTLHPGGRGPVCVGTITKTQDLFPCAVWRPRPRLKWAPGLEKLLLGLGGLSAFGDS
jgi:hypothetical protein